MSSCKISPNFFCFVCGIYIFKNGKALTDTLKRKYHDCFGIPAEDINNAWTPNTVCSSCAASLHKGKRKRFSTPTNWREPENHDADCYFCLTETNRYNSIQKNYIQYPNVSSVTPAVPLNVSVNEDLSDNIDLNDAVDETCEQDECNDFDEGNDSDESDDSDENTKKYCFNQQELSDLVRDLGLSKENSEILASRLKEKHVLAPKTKISFYRNRDTHFRKFFSTENALVYCNNVEGLINAFNSSLLYEATDWRLFLDSSCKSFKAILLHNGNVYAPIPIAHSVVLKEEYENLKFILQKLEYEKHEWQLCGDLKIITILLGQQSGFTKFPCFLCEWDSRARDQHYKQAVWPSRSALVPGSQNIIHEALVKPSKILLPPLHIKLGLIKQFVKALKSRESNAFTYLAVKFPKLSESKIKEGVFDGPQIRTLLKDQQFQKHMSAEENAAWESFRAVVTKFLGNVKDPNFKEIVGDLVKNYEQIGALMNLKLHFLNSHLDYFPENLGDVSEEQGERCHQDLKTMEQRYQGVWNERMISDYCWSLDRDTTNKHKRKGVRRSFETKITRFYKKES